MMGDRDLEQCCSVFFLDHESCHPSRVAIVTKSTLPGPIDLKLSLGVDQPWAVLRQP